MPQSGASDDEHRTNIQCVFRVYLALVQGDRLSGEHFVQRVPKAVFTVRPVLYRILANRARRVDFASGLHSHY